MSTLSFWAEIWAAVREVVPEDRAEEVYLGIAEQVQIVKEYFDAHFHSISEEQAFGIVIQFCKHQLQVMVDVSRNE